MSQSITVLNNATVPQGEFGARQPGGNPPGIIQLTNLGTTTGRIVILGSLDGQSWDNLRGITVRSGRTKIRKLKFPPHIKFLNRSASFGPATLILNNAD